jgi:hypothetical protein
MATGSYVAEQVFSYLGLVFWSFQLAPQGKQKCIDLLFILTFL